MRTTFATDILEALLLSVEERALGYQQLRKLAAQVSVEFDFRVDVAVNHMRTRENLIGDSYPFEVLPVAIRKKPGCEQTPYVALLTLSPEGVFRHTFGVRDIEQASIEFERFVEQAIVGLSGPGTQSVRFGWPSDVGRPMGFPEAISWLGEMMGLSLGGGFRPPRRKDGGVDVIAWRRFRDGKSAFPIFLVQCTIQSDLQKKAEDIDLRNWAYWLDFSRDPQPILAVPHEIASQDESWNELSLKSLVLDRARLLELLEISTNLGGSYVPSQWLESKLDSPNRYIQSL